MIVLRKASQKELVLGNVEMFVWTNSSGISLAHTHFN